ncbi:hypothetical protein ABK040_002075 [Willaertia magna]
MNGFIILSSKIGTPIYSKELKESFGLKEEDENNIERFEEKEEHHLISSNDNVVIGENIIQAQEKETNKISDMGLSGLIFALKLNAEMCLKEQEEGNNQMLLSYFSYNNTSIYFYENTVAQILCAVFLKKQILKEEDEYNKEGIGYLITKELCDRFANKYKNILLEQVGGIKRKFNNFQVEINSIYKLVLNQLLKSLTEEIYLQTNDNIICDWIYLCYSNELANYCDANLMTSFNNINNKNINDYKLKPTFSYRENQIPSSPSSQESLTNSDFNEYRTSFTQKITKLFQKKKVKSSSIDFISEIIGPLQMIYSKEKPKNNNLNNNLNSIFSTFCLLNQFLGMKGEKGKIMKLKDIVNNNPNVNIHIFRKGILFLCFSMRINLKDVNSNNNNQYETIFSSIIKSYSNRIELFLQSIRDEKGLALNN